MLSAPIAPAAPETGTRQVEALALYRRAGFIGIQAYGEYTASSTTGVCLAKWL